jgi:cell wall-associated NlpC family hydrolase
MRSTPTAVAALALLPGVLGAQGVGVGISRWLNSPHVTQYQVGVGGFGHGPFRFTLSGQFLEQAAPSKAHWYGGGAELVLRTTASAQPYLIGGLAVGAGRGPTGGGEAPGMGAWGGVGAELFSYGPIGLQAEALYNWRSKVQLRGVSLGLRLGAKFGRRGATAAAPAPGGPAAESPPSAPVPAANPADEEALRLATAAGTSASPAAAEVIVTAVAAMGAPYRWGGSDANGFDCSGLIRYAYAEHGISIPRRSTDQAGAGSEVGRDLASLRPGDILTFAAEPGGAVSHVGLYVGEGRFIHSARGGVQISILGPEDAIGKWWWARWVGARRVVS